MYRQAEHFVAPVPRPNAASRARYTGSNVSTALAAALTVLFVAVTVLRVAGSFTHPDLRLVARIVPARYHPHVLALIHPLVHLGDAAFVAGVAIVSMTLLWLLGYRRTWAMLLALLSWPIELGCKAILPQPDGLGNVAATVTVTSLVHGASSHAVLHWLAHATPAGVGALVQHAGGATLDLVSSYPSGTTARGTYVLGLFIWLVMRLRVPVLSELLAIALLAPMLVLGLAMVLYAWHWPSDVLGGYILGFAMLFASLALLRRPVRARKLRGTAGETLVVPNAPS